MALYKTYEQKPPQMKSISYTYKDFIEVKDFIYRSIQEFGLHNGVTREPYVDVSFDRDGTLNVTIGLWNYDIDVDGNQSMPKNTHSWFAPVGSHRTLYVSKERGFFTSNPNIHNYILIDETTT